MQLFAFFVVNVVDTVRDQAQYDYYSLEESLSANLFVIYEKEYRTDQEKHPYCGWDDDRHEAQPKEFRIFLYNYLASILAHFRLIIIK